MDRDAQIEGLQAATPGIPVSELLAGLLQDGQMVADGPTDEQAPRVIDGLADLLAARDFADADMAGTVGEDRDVAREERPVRTAQVQQHAVAPGDGDDSKLGDCRDGHGRSQTAMGGINVVKGVTTA